MGRQSGQFKDEALVFTWGLVGKSFDTREAAPSARRLTQTGF